MFTRVKSDNEIKSMRISGHMLANVLGVLKKNIATGMSTQDLADLAAKELKTLGGQPAFLGYYGFPDVLCVSVNDEVVHGIPNSKKIIQNGDIVSMDFGVVYQGMITDAAVTVIVGKPRSQAEQDLVKNTEKALLAGIRTLHGGVLVGDISVAVQAVLEKEKYGIVRDLVGHGVGHQLHEDPNIPNYGQSGFGPKLESGMTIAIEPMATLGDHRVYVEDDDWTVRTKDGSRSAHFEHTVLIAEKGYEILTKL
jgi:methionyl aminopeptidase